MIKMANVTAAGSDVFPRSVLLLPTAWRGAIAPGGAGRRLWLETPDRGGAPSPLLQPWPTGAFRRPGDDAWYHFRVIRRRRRARVQRLWVGVGEPATWGRLIRRVKVCLGVFKY